MPEVQNFNEAFERHLGEVRAEVERQMENPETRSAPERDIVKRAVESVTRRSRQESPNGQTTNENNDLPSYITASKTDIAAQEEVTHLISVALKKGIIEAEAEASKRPAFVVDAFHDALVDKILPELKKRGMMK